MTFDTASIPYSDRTPNGAIKGIIRYDIYLDGHFVGSLPGPRMHCVTSTSMNSCPRSPNRAALRRKSMSYRAAQRGAKVGNAPPDNRESTANNADPVDDVRQQIVVVRC